MIFEIFNNAFSIAAQILGHPLVCIPFSLFILISVISSFCAFFFGSSSKSNDTDDLDEELSIHNHTYKVKVNGYNRSLGSYNKR